MNVLFHLAFPVYDFQLTKHFYVDQLGCRLGRESEHALIMEFGSHQIVAHKVETVLEEQQGIYPRHFGLIFLIQKEFAEFIERLNQQKMPYEVPLKTRFPNTRIEHQSFFLKDPSTNLLEFKYYTYDTAIFAERDFKRIGEHN